MDPITRMRSISRMRRQRLARDARGTAVGLAVLHAVHQIGMVHELQPHRFGDDQRVGRVSRGLLDGQLAGADVLDGRSRRRRSTGGTRRHRDAAALPVTSVPHLPAANRLAAKIFSRRINACCVRNSVVSRSMFMTASALPRNWSGIGFRLGPHVAEVGRRVVDPVADAGGRSAGSALLHLVAEEVAAIVDVVPVGLLGDRDHGAHLRRDELVLALKIRDADLRQRRIHVNITGSRRVHIV